MVSKVVLLIAVLSGGLPPLPSGYAFVVDTDGAYLLDTDGAYLIVESS